MKKLLTKRTILILALSLIVVCVALCLIFRNDIDRALYPREYSELVETYAEQYDVPVNLVYAVIRTESGFDPNAVSSAGAMGLMQLMPTTFRWLSDDMLGDCLADDMICDPQTNVRYGVYYLRRLYDRYGDWMTACAAYNAGNGNVDRWLQDSALTDLSGELIPDRIPLGETRAYVQKVQKSYLMYEGLYPSDSFQPFS